MGKRTGQETSETGAVGITESARPRGFAAMDPKLVRELARRGGKAAQRKGTAHAFTSEEARIAGRKGGIAARARRERAESR